MHQIKRLFHNAVFSGCALATVYTGPVWAMPPGSATPYSGHEQAAPPYYDSQQGYPGTPAYPGYTQPGKGYPRYRYSDHPSAGKYPPPRYGYPSVPAYGAWTYGSPDYRQGGYPRHGQIPHPPPDYDSTAPGLPASALPEPTPATAPAAATPATPQMPAATTEQTPERVYRLFDKNTAAAATSPAPATVLPSTESVMAPDPAAPAQPVSPSTPAAEAPAVAPAPDSLQDQLREKADEMPAADAAVDAVLQPAAAAPPGVEPAAPAPTGSATATPEPVTPAAIAPSDLPLVTPEPALPEEPVDEPATGPESLYEKTRATMTELLDTKDSATAPATDLPADPAAATAPPKTAPAIDEPGATVPNIPPTPAGGALRTAPGDPQSILASPAGPYGSTATESGTAVIPRTGAGGEPAHLPAAPAGPYPPAKTGEDVL